MGDNSNFIDLLSEFNSKKVPFKCNISFVISAIDGDGMIISIEDESLIESEFFAGSRLSDNITVAHTIPKEPGYYIAKVLIDSFQSNHPMDPVEWDEVISLEQVQLVVTDKKTGKIEFDENTHKIKKRFVVDESKVIKRPPVNQFGKPLKPSGQGIVVDKSNATKTFPMRSREFPPYHGLNE